jgi:hypothetical protein
MKPAASTVCFETIILWFNNKTTDWLNKLDPDEKNIFLIVLDKWPLK